MKKIILTGGGSAGHVTPNLALVPALREAGFEVMYVGSAEGIENTLARKAGVPYSAISTGKLRRDKLLSLTNARDIIAAVAGVGDAVKIIKREKPDIIFSKGGFVGLPVAVAGWLCRTVVILHESDISSGLANRLSFSFARAVCASFPETMRGLPPKKAYLTGNPIRSELLTGDSEQGRKLCGFDNAKPVVMMMGGSLGSEKLNAALRAALPLLLPDFNIVHICGRGKLDDKLDNTAGYAAFEYLDSELRHVLAAASIIVSRAGSNSLNEFLALRKPSLLIPLGRVSRGDQAQNAASFAARGFSAVLDETVLTPETLTAGIKELYAQRETYIANMEKSPMTNAVGEILKVILKYSG